MLLSDMSSGVEVKAEKLFSREQKAFLTFLSSASGSQSKAILSTLSSEQVKFICEIAYNLLNLPPLSQLKTGDLSTLSDTRQTTLHKAAAAAAAPVLKKLASFPLRRRQALLPSSSSAAAAAAAALSLRGRRKLISDNYKLISKIIRGITPHLLDM